MFQHVFGCAGLVQFSFQVSVVEEYMKNEFPGVSVLTKISCGAVLSVPLFAQLRQFSTLTSRTCGCHAGNGAATAVPATVYFQAIGTLLPLL